MIYINLKMVLEPKSNKTYLFQLVFTSGFIFHVYAFVYVYTQVRMNTNNAMQTSWV